MPNLTYQEKSLLAAIVAEVIVYSGYFASVSNTSADLGRMIASVIAIVVIQIALHIVLALTSGSRLIDERDRLIEGRAFVFGYFALLSGIVAVAGLALLYSHLTPVFVVNTLLAVVVAAEMVKNVSQLVLSRTSL